jgi:hypothetical protein
MDTELSLDARQESGFGSIVLDQVVDRVSPLSAVVESEWKKSRVFLQLSPTSSHIENTLVNLKKADKFRILFHSSSRRWNVNIS